MTTKLYFQSRRALREIERIIHNFPTNHTGGVAEWNEHNPYAGRDYGHVLYNFLALESANF